MTTRRAFLLGLAVTPLAAACEAQSLSEILEKLDRSPAAMSPEDQARVLDYRSTRNLIQSARTQIGVTTRYDPAYVRLEYPGGDIDRSKGVCTDVIIRAYRGAFDYDLQKAIHEDMRSNFSAYPKIWGLTRPDRNIDHRRVPNIERFLKRSGHESRADDWQAGDLITCRLPGNLPHIAIVSNQLGPDGLPKVIHNIGRGTREEPLIGLYSNERRFRFFPAA